MFKVRSALVVFAKEPQEGCVKTRLAKDLKEGKVLDLYKAFVKDVLNIGLSLDVKHFLYYGNPVEELNFLKQFKSDYELMPQSGSDLGERMFSAFEECQQRGFQKTILIGTDCLTLSEDILHEALAELEDHDCVLGPSEDGGYYLMGLKKPLAAIFQNISWSSERVYGQTVRTLESLNLSWHRLPEKNDIDTIDGLNKFIKTVENTSIAPYTRDVLKQSDNFF